MKTMQQIKDDYAVSKGYQNFRHMDQNSTITERDVDKIMQLVIDNRAC